MAEFGLVAAQRGAGFKDLIAIVSDLDDPRLPALAREDEACRRQSDAPGMGPVIATAMVATVGDARLFGSGRSFAAWLAPPTNASRPPRRSIAH